MWVSSDRPAGVSHLDEHHPTPPPVNSKGKWARGTGIPHYLCNLPILQNKVCFKTFLSKLPSPQKERKSFLPRVELE